MFCSRVEPMGRRSKGRELGWALALCLGILGATPAHAGETGLLGALAGTFGDLTTRHETFLPVVSTAGTLAAIAGAHLLGNPATLAGFMAGGAGIVGGALVGVGATMALYYLGDQAYRWWTGRGGGGSGSPRSRWSRSPGGGESVALLGRAADRTTP